MILTASPPAYMRIGITTYLNSFRSGNVISMLLFVLATVFALVAWIRCSTDEYAVSYRDVAGALAFIGIGAAALVEPNELVRLVAGTHPER